MLRVTLRGAVAVVAAAVVLTTAAAPARAWTPDARAAAEYAESRAGDVAFAVVRDDGRAWRYRAATSVPTASVLKVMFMVAYLRLPEVRDRDLRDADRDLLRPMIRRSDNATATRIADRVGPRRMDRLADRAGMRDFSYTRPWGASRTSARDEAAFMRRVHHRIPRRHRTYAMRLLARIVDDQRWGVGEIDLPPGWTAHFKGGWGSGTGAVDHQVVQLRHRDGRRHGLAVTTTNSPSHDYATRTLRGVFRRLLANLG